MKKSIYITAAPVGAVPKYLDPLEPKFIPSALMDHLVDEQERQKMQEQLKRNGWEAVGPGGIALQAGYDTSVADKALTSISPEKSLLAMQALEKAGWKKDGSSWASSQAEGVGRVTPIIKSSFLDRLKSKTLIRQIVLQLTTYGWLVNEDGDIVWTRERVHSYLPPDVVTQIQAADSGLLTMLICNGWEHMGAGLWQSGKAYSPYLPITANSIIEETLRCFHEGAAIVHLHTRATDDAQSIVIPGLGAPVRIGAQRNHIVLDQYDEIVPKVVGLEPSGILNLSTSARGDRAAASDPLRRAHLKHYGACQVVPDIASLSPGAVVFQGGGGYDNTHNFLCEQLAHFKLTGVRPEIEVFNHAVVNNAIGGYKRALKTVGEPVLFMLVAGVDQYWRDPITGDTEDDSLIAVAARKQIGKLLQESENVLESEQAAVKIAVEQLSPTVQKLRQHFPSSKISLLFPGTMHAILVDVAIALDLDGIRVGLEDALNVYDDRAPGGIRRALGTSEQVRMVRTELERRGFDVIPAESLRNELGVSRPDVALFHSVMSALEPWLECASDVDHLPSAAAILKALSSLMPRYERIEDDLALELARQLASCSTSTDPDTLAGVIRDCAHARGVPISFSMEERERYADHEHLLFKEIYVPQALNFARELVMQRNISCPALDAALDRYAQLGVTVTHPAATYRIDDGRFKSKAMRFFEYVAAIPCRYNADRTNVTNVHLRGDDRYSATMALLYHAIYELTLQAREHSVAARRGADVAWCLHTSVRRSRTSPEKGLCEQSMLDAAQVQPYIDAGVDWVLLPSTVTTHHALGLKSLHALASAFCRYMTDVVCNVSSRKVRGMEGGGDIRLLSMAHAGVQRDGRAQLEASLLRDRFVLNTDHRQHVANHASKLIYGRLLLPRLVASPDALLYTDDQLVARDAEGFPLYRDGSRAVRVGPAAIKHLSFLRFLSHSSGISTLQQLDNLTRIDAQKLGFSADEVREIFDRALAVSFSSASDVRIDQPGTSVIDITAFNDVRSLAGTTTPDYLLSPGDQIERLRQTLLHSRAGEANDYTYAQAVPNWYLGPYGKNLVRLSNVFLLDDPRQLHDGHSIRRYLDCSPVWLHQWLSEIHDAQAQDGAAELLRRLRESIVLACTSYVSDRSSIALL